MKFEDIAQALLTETPSKEQLASMSLVDVVHAWSAIRQLCDQIQDMKSDLESRVDSCRFNLVPTKMEAEGIEVITVEGVGRVSLTSDLRASIVPETKPAAYEWLVENGHAGIITETVNAQTLAALVRDKLRKGESMPEALFKVTPFTRATITKTR